MAKRLTRRAFLKRSGAAAIGGLGIGASAPASLAAPVVSNPVFPEPMGRAFLRTAIHAAPDESSPVCDYLTPDGITPILARSGQDWYQLPGGYVLREALQPILPYARPALVEIVGEGFWAEAVSPSSAVREWCAGAAPVVSRLGFGAVVYVIDRLTDDHGQVWYGLAAAPGSTLVGWASALHYGALLNAWTPGAFPATIRLRIDRGELRIEQGGQILGKTEIGGPKLPAGETALHAVQPGAAFLHDRTPLGLPWLMRLDTGQRVYGAWWHNQFDANTGPDLMLPTLAARWLYGWLVCHDRPAMLIVM